MKITTNHPGRQYCRELYGFKDFWLDLESGISSLFGPNSAGKVTFVCMPAMIYLREPESS